MTTTTRSRGVSTSTIQKMVRRIVREFRPERIVLFGSHARGTAGPDSDVDLLVVLPVTGSKREKRLEIRMAIQDIPAPKDVLVATPEEMVKFRDIPGTMIYPIVREGKDLYVRRG